MFVGSKSLAAAQMGALGDSGVALCCVSLLDDSGDERSALPKLRQLAARLGAPVAVVRDARDFASPVEQLTGAVGYDPRRDADEQAVVGRDRMRRHDRAGRDDATRPDARSHEDDGVRADVRVRSNHRRSPLDRPSAFGEASANRGVRVYLRPSRDVAALADLQAAAAVEQAERPDPAAVADVRLAEDPGVWVVRVGWQVMPRRRLIHAATLPTVLVDDHQPRLAFVSGWYRILPADLLARVPLGWLAVQASALPAFGFAPLV
jgi:hypothetical protein